MAPAFFLGLLPFLFYFLFIGAAISNFVFSLFSNIALLVMAFVFIQRLVRDKKFWPRPWPAFFAPFLLWLAAFFSSYGYNYFFVEGSYELARPYTFYLSFRELWRLLILFWFFYFFSFRYLKGSLAFFLSFSFLHAAMGVWQYFNAGAPLFAPSSWGYDRTNFHYFDGGVRYEAWGFTGFHLFFAQTILFGMFIFFSWLVFRPWKTTVQPAASAAWYLRLRNQFKRAPSQFFVWVGLFLLLFIGCWVASFVLNVEPIKGLLLSALASLLFLSLVIGKEEFFPSQASLPSPFFVRPWARAILACVVGAVFIEAMVVSFARSSWLGSIFSAILMAVAALAIWLPWRKPKTIFVTLGALAFAGLAAFVILAVFIPDNLLYRRFSSIFVLGANLDRLYMWQAAFKVLEQSPIFGSGFANYQPLADAYLEIGREVDHTFINTPQIGVHNVWLQAWINYGLAGVLAIAWLIFWPMWQVAKAFPAFVRAWQQGSAKIEQTKFRLYWLELGIFFSFAALFIIFLFENVIEAGHSKNALWSFLALLYFLQHHRLKSPAAR